MHLARRVSGNLRPPDDCMIAENQPGKWLINGVCLGLKWASFGGMRKPPRLGGGCGFDPSAAYFFEHSAIFWVFEWRQRRTVREVQASG